MWSKEEKKYTELKRENYTDLAWNLQLVFVDLGLIGLKEVWHFL